MAEVMRDSLWYAPFASPGGATPLQSAYKPAPGAAIGDAQPFTIQLDAVHLAVSEGQAWYDRFRDSDRDVVIYSTTQRGDNAPVTRVHYYKNDIDLRQPQDFRNLPSRTMHVCVDYPGDEPVHLAIKVATPGNLGRKYQPVIDALNGLLTSAQSFPAVAPYVDGAKLTTQVAQGLVTMLDQEVLPHALQMEDDVALDPPSDQRIKPLQTGRFVVFNRAVEGQGAADVSDAVFRINARQEPDSDFVISQRIATLLSGLDAAQSGASGGNAKPAIDFLRDTMTAYSNFKESERYRQLQAIPADQRTDSMKVLMTKIASNEGLKPYLQSLAQQ